MDILTVFSLCGGALFYFIQMLWKLPFPSCDGARSPRGLRVTGSKLCRCRILAALWVCSRRHPVVPRGRGNCKPVKAGIFPLPCVCLWAAASVPPLCGKHFHVLVNPLGFTLRTLSLSPLPLSPLWKLVVGSLYILGRVCFAFRSPFVRSLKLLCCCFLGRLLKQSALFLCIAALFFATFLYFYLRFWK